MDDKIYMKKAIILSLICAGLLATSNIGDLVFAQDTTKNINKTNNVEVQVINKLNKEEAEELLSMYNPNVKYIYQGTENDFVALKEKGLEGYVFLMDADTDLGMFVNKDDAKIYYFHPSGYLELAE